MKQKIPTPPGMNEPIGQYSYGYKTQGRVYLCGLAGLASDGTVLGHGDMGAQSARIFDRMEAILGQAGASLANVIRMRTYVTTLEGIEGHQAEVRKRFNGNYPADTLVVVKGLWDENMLIEIEATAVLDD